MFGGCRLVREHKIFGPSYGPNAICLVATTANESSHMLRAASRPSCPNHHESSSSRAKRSTAAASCLYFSVGVGGGGVEALRLGSSIAALAGLPPTGSVRSRKTQTAQSKRSERQARSTPPTAPDGPDPSTIARWAADLEPVALIATVYPGERPRRQSQPRGRQLRQRPQVQGGREGAFSVSLLGAVTSKCTRARV